MVVEHFNCNIELSFHITVCLSQITCFQPTIVLVELGVCCLRLCRLYDGLVRVCQSSSVFGCLLIVVLITIIGTNSDNACEL